MTSTFQEKKVLLLDIDHTLFDTRLYTNLCYQEIFTYTGSSDKEEFIRVCNQLYAEQRKVGPFTTSQFIDSLYVVFPIQTKRSTLEKIFADETIIRKALYPDTEETLQKLSQRKDLLIGVFSTGPLHHQRSKINSLLSYFHQEHIHINEADKIKDIPSILERHKERKVYVVDDLAKVLHNFKAKNDSIITILIERDVILTKDQVLDFEPDYRVKSLDEIIQIINM